MGFTLYPAVDISEGKCVRLLQGRFGTETVYSDDPVKVAIGLGKAGARWLHIVDLDGAKTGEAKNRDLVLEVVRRASCPVQAGGGLRSMDDVTEMLAAGANRAVLGTVALEDPAELERVCAHFGERIAVSLDARGDELATHGWTVGSGVPLLDAVKTFERAGAATFIYTDVSRDGTMSGPNLDALSRLASSTSRPVIASGGIASLADLVAVARMHGENVRGAIVGRALYEGKFSVGEAQYAADEAAAGRIEEPLSEPR
ncbi:MAG TPA: 1-(5-phosphoribosyl)-5-[(5-phosphoribosylamino)methylideneamino]imidazole-4-carboxamide isomerase [Actinomycetota bacterium]|nr:1-(5-phosphoribosyl)-5-[(5-phosphoribosylamino)methylideneamino]imidazole-4-carboxamide isomerase [Actinomycetota bacterium]